MHLDRIGMLKAKEASFSLPILSRQSMRRAATPPPLQQLSAAVATAASAETSAAMSSRPPVYYIFLRPCHFRMIYLVPRSSVTSVFPVYSTEVAGTIAGEASRPNVHTPAVKVNSSVVILITSLFGSPT